MGQDDSCAVATHFAPTGTTAWPRADRPVPEITPELVPGGLRRSTELISVAFACPAPYSPGPSWRNAPSLVLIHLIRVGLVPPQGYRVGSEISEWSKESQSQEFGGK